MEGSRGLAPRMIGRQAQLEELEEHFRQVRAGSGRLVLVAGEAGVGKTRLVRAALERTAPAPGVEILRGDCDEEQPPAPYGPFVGALRAAIRAQGPEPVLAAAGPLAADLLPLLPELGRPSSASDAPSDPQTRKHRLFEALYRTLRPWVGGPCRIVVLEDLHWADQSSLDVLRHLAWTGAQDPLLLLGTYRSDDVEHGHPLHHTLAQLARNRLLHQVRLAPLTRPELAQMLVEALGRAVPDPFVAAIEDYTGGNPFFVEEILGALLEEGRLDQTMQALHRGRSAVRLAVPRSVAESSQRRTADLDEATVQVLHYAAVIGRRFDFDLLLCLTGLGEEALARAVSRLAARQIVLEERGSHVDRYHFRHALSREAIYEGLLGRDRRRKHRAVLEALEAMHPDDQEPVVDQLAYHSLQAGEVPRAARYAELAGDRSARLPAFREAMGHYQTALELQGAQDPHARADLLLRLAEVAFPVGDIDVYERCWREARQLYERLGDRRMVGTLSTRLGHTAQTRTDLEAALRHHRAAVTVLEAEPPGPELAMAYSQLANHYRLRGRPRDCVAWGEKALQLADALGDPRVRVDALVYLGVGLRDLGELRQAAGYLERAVTVARATDLVQGALNAFMHLDAILVHLGDFGRAAAVYEEGLDLARRLGWEVRMSGDCSGGGQALMELGRWEQAHEALDRVFRASEMGHPYGRFEAAPIKAELLLRQGRCEQARQLLEAMLPEYEARNELFMVLPALAPVRLACGDHAGALSALDTTIAPVRGRAARLWGLGLLCRGIEVYRGLGREEQALALLPEFVALAESSESLVAPAMLADTEGYTEGTQGHHAAAAEQFQRAATAWQRIGTPYQEARSRRFRAVSLLRSGGRAMREEARGELATAREICTRLAAPRELAAIATVARQHGLAARPAASAPDHDHRLTRREREVAALIARGASNRAIAQALFLSEKTVETHVSNILGKLAFTSRAQVAAYAVEQGLAGAGSS